MLEDAKLNHIFFFGKMLLLPPIIYTIEFHIKDIGNKIPFELLYGEEKSRLL